MTTTSGLTHLPWNSAAAGTDAPCVQDLQRSLTYAELEAEARAFADQLADLGLREGDVIGIMLPNSVELLVAMLGAWIAGVVATPVNPTLTEREVTYQLEDARARLLITDKPDRADVLHLLKSELRRTPTSAGPITIDPNRLALLVYTSGSTGKPKGVMLDHRNLEAMATMMARHFELTSDDHALLVLPLFHVNSICVTFLAPMSVGARVTILERFQPATFLDAMARFAPTYFSAVPAIFAHLAALPETDGMTTSRLRFAVCGAAPVSPELLARCEARFGMSIVEGYGLTEATCASACNPVSGIRKPGTVGPALPGQQIRILDSSGHEVATGERGEIVISGPTVMRGYLGRIEATAETIPDGWLRTGDVGILDEDGYLRVVDRIKDMIIRGGENLYPKEIEGVLATHPAVLESAVVGRADDVLGEVPVAFVVLAPDGQADAEELIAHCAKGLAKIKVPVAVEIVDALPRNPVGKIDKPTLRRSLVAA